jgi:hypothetical protein
MASQAALCLGPNFIFVLVFILHSASLFSSSLYLSIILGAYCMVTGTSRPLHASEGGDYNLSCLALP